jgi:DNA polymerase III delta prime subunit
MRRFVILEGPPGTGKTRLAYRLAERIGSSTRIQFHPARTYEDFVVGLFPRPTGDGLAFDVRPGDLLRANEAAKAGEHLLLIDEINRADLARVLGEALVLFEVGAERRVRSGFPTWSKDIRRISSFLPTYTCWGPATPRTVPLHAWTLRSDGGSLSWRSGPT